MDISVRRTSASIVEDRSWLGDLDGTQATRSITLVPALFTMATHFPKGVLRSGIVLGRVTANGATKGMYGPYDNTATDGREVAKGFLFNTIQMVEDGGLLTANKGAPMLERGFIRPWLLPAGNGLDAAARVDLAAHFKFRDE
ncbi:head decoration protein [Micromonospora tulbaghiae]|uniref:head decoration protein n=1 Tax=Micromonospora tulbaghiae TaxID=479978 RepID=UPI00333060B6